MGIKILQTKKSDFYFGIESEEERYKKPERSVKSPYIISYKIAGGKQLCCKGKNPESIPRVEVGQSLCINVDYQKGEIVWLIEDEEVKKLHISFEGSKWFPFISFKQEDDKVELIRF